MFSSRAPFDVQGFCFRVLELVLVLALVHVPLVASFSVRRPSPLQQRVLSPTASEERLPLSHLRLIAPKENASDDDGQEASSPQLMEDGDDDELMDFSWMEGMKQWPLVPPAVASSSDDNTPFSPSSKLWTDKMVTKLVGENEREEGASNGKRLKSKTKNPQSYDSALFSNLINLEAILDLAGNATRTNIFEAADAWVQSLTALARREEEAKTIRRQKQLRSREQANQFNGSTTTTVEELLEREQWLESTFDFSIPGAPSTTNSTGASSRSGKGGSLARLSWTQTRAIAASNNAPSGGNSTLAQAAEAIMKDATSRIEYLVSEASTALSPSGLEQLIMRLSETLSSTTASDEIVQAAARLARSRGLDVQFATDKARETTRYASKLARVSKTVLGGGYAYGSVSQAAGSEKYLLSTESGGMVAPVDEVVKPLFADFPSARRVEPLQYDVVVAKGAEMGILAGAIYERTSEQIGKLGHALVANGTSADVAWMVTDAIDYDSAYKENPAIAMGQAEKQERPMLVRTLTIRGFDASDELVDRERLLNVICTASSKGIRDNGVVFHSGLLDTASEIYRDVKKYLEHTAPENRIVLNGHSIGGSLAVLILLLMEDEYGAEYVGEKILRVFTHGSPPIAMSTSDFGQRSVIPLPDPMEPSYPCSILEAFDLPPDIVFGYVQPYDPIVRFLTEYDALYPLVDDIGQDEVTLYASGPRRSLRPVARALFQSWDGWPQFRESWRGTKQRYQSVGMQHLLLPDPLRYLNDRFVSTNVGVPPTEAIVRISSGELLPALNSTFPLDVFQISLIPQAVRSFLHHFYPAYDMTIANYAGKVERLYLEEEGRSPATRFTNDQKKKPNSKSSPKNIMRSATNKDSSSKPTKEAGASVHISS